MSLAHLFRRASLLAALLALAAPALATCPPVTLQPRASLPTAPGPNEVVAADVNGDGVLDLVLTNVDGSTVGILPGIAPGGTFGARVDLLVASTPISVQVADLDQDGTPDLIVGSQGARGIQVLRGLGGGSFGAPMTFTTGTQPYEIALGDFNHDGVTDVAVADVDVHSIHVLIGGRDGGGHWDGTFSQAIYPTVDRPLGIVTGDFNEDGITDIVVTEYAANTVAVFLGNGSGNVGDGTFQAAVHFPAGRIPYDLATGDFNGDGHLDLAVSNSDWNGVHILFGSGTGTFPTAHAYVDGENCAGIAPADFDGDGITDLAVDDCVNNQLLLLKGQGSGGVGDGTFASPVVLADCCFPVHVIAADLDGNGHPDAVTCDYQASALGLFRDGCAPNPNVPHITKIRDVPNDQGGKVFITWLRSSLDATGGPVNAYVVWRQVPPGSPALRSLSADPTLVRRTLRARPDGATDIVYWEALATLPAQRLDGYGYTAATPQDSLHGSNPLSTYYVSALTADIDVHYDSAPDSGYSVDNLPPGRPSALAADWSAGGASLHWTANTEPDLEHYAVYRSDDPAFTPSPATLIGSPTTDEFIDPAPHPLATYKVAAVDKHDNESDFASLDMRAVTGVGDGRAGTTWLASPWPNPARGPFDLRFGLAREGPVTIVVMDAQGRRVRTLADGVHPAGDAAIRWDARNESGALVGAGLYWLDLKAGPQHLVRRFALVR
jgi:hypothetical protein